DRGGEDLVAGEDLRPCFDALVRGDQYRALLVAMLDDAEEQRRVLSAHWLEADLVQDQKTGVDVLLASQERWREVCIAAQHGQQLIQSIEDDAEPVLDGLDGEGHCEVGLADAWRTAAAALRFIWPPPQALHRGREACALAVE